MSIHHRLYCRSRSWGQKLDSDIVPWLLRDVELGSLTLEIGPGAGVSTEVILRYAFSVVVLERQRRQLAALRSQLGDAASVVVGDGVAAPFGSKEFTSVLSVMVLHHVWRHGAREQMLREAFRVLKPGGIIVGVDATPAALRRKFVHLGDRIRPVDPSQLLTELRAVGFEAVAVECRNTKFKFSGRRPAARSRQPRGAPIP